MNTVYKILLVALLSLIGFNIAGSVHAQTSCLKYPSNAVPPSAYGASWDVFSSAKEVLIKTSCPTSGTNLTLTIGRGNSNQLVYKHYYTYNGSWTKGTFPGATSDWITGQASASITAPSTASVSSPWYLVGYVCTNVSGSWKCGCKDSTCANRYWQLQGYTGIGGGGDDDDDNASADQVANPPAPLNTVSVSSSDGLRNALSTAQPGDHIVLENGTYSGTFTFSRSGQSSKPIVIKAKNLLGATIDGQIKMTGDWQWVHGLKLDGGTAPSVLIDMASHVYVTRNHFTGTAGINMKRTQYYNFGWNKFTPTPHVVGVVGANDSFHIKVHSNDLPNNPTIHGHVYRNYFYDRDTTEGEFHVMYLGDYDPSGYPSADLLIEHNFVDSNKRRMFYTKLHGATQQYNTFIGHGRGSSGIRHGGYGKIWGNYMENINIFMISNKNNDIRGNKLVGKAEFWVDAGTTPGFQPRRDLTTDSKFIGNDGGKVKLGWSDDPHATPVRNILFERHTGVIEYDPFVVMSTITVNPTTSQTVPQYVKLNANQVGPEAPGAY